MSEPPLPEPFLSVAAILFAVALIMGILVFRLKGGTLFAAKPGSAWWWQRQLDQARARWWNRQWWKALFHNRREGRFHVKQQNRLPTISRPHLRGGDLLRLTHDGELEPVPYDLFAAVASLLWGRYP